MKRSSSKQIKKGLQIRINLNFRRSLKQMQNQYILGECILPKLNFDLPPLNNSSRKSFKLFNNSTERTKFQLILNQYEIYIRQKKSQKIVVFLNLDAVTASVSLVGKGLQISFPRSELRIYMEPIIVLSIDFSDQLQNNEEEQKQEKTESSIAKESFKWLHKIQSIIKRSRGREKCLTYLILKNPKDFYKREQATNEQFNRLANTGDIILFKSNHIAAKATRILTRSDYDYVGVIIRNRENKLYLFHATSEGVQLEEWIPYLMSISASKVCWRPLKIELTANDIKVIENFIQSQNGKKFAITIKKLFTMTSALEKTEKDDQKKDYFCSQLVARLYKELGILNANTSSTQYYPSDFSENKELLIIKKNAKLENQRLLTLKSN